MMLAIRNDATAEVQFVCSIEGYGEDWSVLPDPPEWRGWAWDGAAWVRDLAPALAALRAERDARLRACDWTQLPDVPEPTRLAWLTYRQALRDLPETTIDPFAPEWPTPPA